MLLQVLSGKFCTLSDIKLRRGVCIKSLLRHNASWLSWVSSLPRVGRQCISIEQCTSKCLHTNRCKYCIVISHLHDNEMPTTKIAVWVVAVSSRRFGDRHVVISEWFAKAHCHHARCIIIVSMEKWLCRKSSDAWKIIVPYVSCRIFRQNRTSGQC